MSICCCLFLVGTLATLQGANGPSFKHLRLSVPTHPKPKPLYIMLLDLNIACYGYKKNNKNDTTSHKTCQKHSNTKGSTWNVTCETFPYKEPNNASNQRIDVHLDELNEETRSVR